MAPSSAVHLSETYSRTQMHYENRDRHVVLPLPSVPPFGSASAVVAGEAVAGSEWPTQPALERWFTEVAMAAFSSAFNFYLNE